MQYCSTAYVQLLQQHHAHISMTENEIRTKMRVAERVNGILKSELISNSYDTDDEASIHIGRCITIYNYKRRHSSINRQIPDDVHKQHGSQIRRWKNYYQSPKNKEASMHEP